MLNLSWTDDGGHTLYASYGIAVLGHIYVANGTLAISDFVICIILSLGIVGPLITVVPIQMILARSE